MPARGSTDDGKAAEKSASDASQAEGERGVDASRDDDVGGGGRAVMKKGAGVGTGTGAEGGGVAARAGDGEEARRRRRGIIAERGVGLGGG